MKVKEDKENCLARSQKILPSLPKDKVKNEVKICFTILNKGLLNFEQLLAIPAKAQVDPKFEIEGKVGETSDFAPLLLPIYGQQNLKGCNCFVYTVYYYRHM